MKISTACKVIALLAIGGLLTNCATTATTSATGTPQTFTQLVAAAESVDDGIIVAATAALQSGAITSAQAKKILVITDGVNTTLTLANTAFAAGNTVNANAQLATVASLLTTVQACLTATAAKQSIDTCLAPIGVP